MSARFAITSFLLLLSSSLFAQDVSLPSPEKLDAVANKQQWSHLLHYRTHPFSGRYLSQNDSKDFFLAENGKHSLVDELEANIQAFLLNVPFDNQSAQCQFPARYHWIKQQFLDIEFVDQPCSELDTWTEEIDAEYVTLVFPASHINSPSSMYGHTFIRLDKKDPKSNKLLAHSVNFAANADLTDNEIVFTWKGLTGGYPGVVSVLPYYAKTNEYSNMEYRDIWEYRLDLNKAEVDQFVRHVWETKDTFFDYFFFDENCSYRLLGLLDASSERIDVTDDFMFTAMPVDTIRALKKRGMVIDTEYRPSAASKMEHKSSNASEVALKQAKKMVESTDELSAYLSGLSEQEQAQSLELAHAYARYLAVKKKQANPVLRKRTLEILSARSKIQTDAGFGEIPTPKYRDDQGHLSQRLSLTTGSAFYDDGHKTQHQEFIDINYRAAFHDVMDLPQGFVPGSQIQMGNLSMRLWEDGAVRLQQLQLIDILSLSHQTHFQKPVAWTVSGGLDRFVGQDAELYGYLNVGFGRAWLTAVGRFYGLAQAELKADNQFHKGAQISVGPRAGWLWQGERIQAQLETNWQGVSLIDKTKRTEINANLGWRASQNIQLKLEAKTQHFKLDGVSNKQHEVGLGFNWYF
mgnify:CR=1 FL=1